MAQLGRDECVGIRIDRRERPGRVVVSEPGER